MTLTADTDDVSTRWEATNATARTASSLTKRPLFATTVTNAKRDFAATATAATLMGLSSVNVAVATKVAKMAVSVWTLTNARTRTKSAGEEK